VEEVKEEEDKEENTSQAFQWTTLKPVKSNPNIYSPFKPDILCSYPARIHT
jgi:hypothetical protein